MKQSEEQIKTYQIRYNTQSTDDSNRWRLISDGGETLVSDIIINTQTKTIGIFSDLFIIKNPAKKFFFQFIIVIFFLLSLKLSIISTKIFFIDYFIKNKFFALLFTAFCLLILINGSNFLDGVNTLVCGYYILVVMTILYIGHYNKINYNFSESYYLFLTLLVILIFNFFSKTYLGDSGTFLLSFVIGYHLISICNINLTSSTYISPIFILLLLWYPAF